MKKRTPPKLTVVNSGTTPPQTWPTPPRQLGVPGLALWKAIQSEFCVDDAGGIEILMNVCAALDRAEALNVLVNEQGMLIRTKNGLKANPAVAAEMQCRAFICRGIQKLGINHQELKSVGRPAGYVPPNREA